ncbi:hypothetical protein AABM34_10620 [Lysinibacillus fusiformis]
MGFDNFNRSEKEPTYKKISRIHDDCEESCNNKNVHGGVQVPQQPVGTGLPGFAYIYDTTAQPAIPNNGTKLLSIQMVILHLRDLYHMYQEQHLSLSIKRGFILLPMKCSLQVVLLHFPFSMATTK